MARSFQRRLTVAVSGLIIVCVVVMSALLITHTGIQIRKQYVARTVLLTNLVRRNIEYVSTLPEEYLKIATEQREEERQRRTEDAVENVEGRPRPQGGGPGPGPARRPPQGGMRGGPRGMGSERVRSQVSDALVQDIVDWFVEDTEVGRVVVVDVDGRVVASGTPKGQDTHFSIEDVVSVCISCLDKENWTHETVEFEDFVGVVSPLEPGLDGKARAVFVQYPVKYNVLLHQRTVYIGGVALVMIFLAIWVSSRLSRDIAKPINVLVKGAEELGSGNLDARVHLETDDEIQTLGETFNKMAGSIQDYTKELADQAKEREHLESELRISAELQESLLPKGLPCVNGVELVGFSQPAFRVGGDFYDYIELPDGRLAVVIADATGKGLPAALLTTQCWSVLRALAHEMLSPGELLKRTNKVLCNRFGGTGRFVTLFFMVLDVDKGTLRYAVAGHNPPILVGANSGRKQLLSSREGLPLGIDPKGTFSELEINLAPSDTVVLYTDGITEALGATDERYGDKRLETVVAKASNEDLHDLVDSIRSDVDEFLGGRQPHDDMTLVAVRFCPANHANC